ncbi:hypothetical protein [Texcoconibacillus texcoconensis]|uniref:Polymer-forming cytoskeletal protein n=1 Tax=Texcoconibacillus texcoconensis TaxID=1095777 RepID=A0A840QQT2_9BACI|nr:hypothetical protein [Texcoconibacillus texcoconensis]MBB5173725.1 hypothetical protein [Texcoconibacillus texcoconensis]
MKLKTLLALGASLTLFTAACSVDEPAETEEAGGDEDAVTGATQVMVEDEDSLLQGISEDGAWIVHFEDDFSTEEDLVLAGDHYNNDELDRKLALYNQDDDRNITDSFTLTAPQLTVQSENTRVQGGTFEGDVFVESNGFELREATIDGDIIFTSEEYEDSAEIGEDSEVTGAISVDESAESEADAVTGATQTVVVDEDSLLEGVSENGGWIVIFEDDFSTEESLVLEGEQTNRGELARKLALYDQDEDRNVTDRYTLTTPELTVRSENTRVQGGIVEGDVYVEANDFTLQDATVDGNIYFASEEYEESSEIDADSEVTGDISVE